MILRFRLGYSRFFAGSEGGALRGWEDACNNPQSQFAKYPQDFGLFCIGEWDDQTCQFSLLENHINYGLAAQYVKAQKVLPFSEKEQLEAGHA